MMYRLFFPALVPQQCEGTAGRYYVQEGTGAVLELMLPECACQPSPLLHHRLFLGPPFVPLDLAIDLASKEALVAAWTRVWCSRYRNSAAQCSASVVPLVGTSPPTTCTYR